VQVKLEQVYTELY